MQIDEIVRSFYKNLPFFTIRMMLLPICLIFLARYMGKGEPIIYYQEDNHINSTMTATRLSSSPPLQLTYSDLLISLILPLMTIRIIQNIGGVEKNPGPTHQCEYCGNLFKRPDNLKRHVQNRHIDMINIRCRFCRAKFRNISEWTDHMKMHKPRTDRWKLSNHAFDQKIIELLYIYNVNSLEEALGGKMLKSVINQLRYYRMIHGQIKFGFNFSAVMQKQGIGGEESNEQFFFETQRLVTTTGELQLSKDVEEQFKILRERVLDTDVDQEGSGWSFVSSEAFKIQIIKSGGKTMGKHLEFKPRNERGNVMRSAVSNIINVKNEDDKCVLYNIIISKFGHKIEEDMTNPENLKKYLKKINDEDVSYPIDEGGIHTLEANNRANLNISINVWRYLSPNHLEPYYISRNISRGHTTCDMLMIEGNVQENGTSHQHLLHIKDKAALFRKKTSQKWQGRKHLFCPACKNFNSGSYEKMSKHFKQCVNPKFFKKIYPQPNDQYLPIGNVIQPPSSYRTSAPVLRAFCDFETLHHQRSEDHCEKCEQLLKNSNVSEKVELNCKHKNSKQSIVCSDLPAICFSLIVINNKQEKVYEKYYRGKDAAEEFINTLMRKKKRFTELIDKHLLLKMTRRDWHHFETSTHCENCAKEFDGSRVKVRDHDHFTGAFRNALCSNCNLQKKNIEYIPVYFHNLTGFDSHLIIQAMKLNKDETDFGTLSRNEEKVITMHLDMYKMIDSLNFMSGSLDSLVTDLRQKDESKFVQTKKMAGENLGVLMQKGVFPYEHITSEEILLETRLPSKEKFYSSLSGTHISDADYEHAKTVWKKFKCKTIGDYMRVYCRSDTHLLSDVWQNFCEVAVKNFQIHPEAGYITLPSFAFDCFKHKTFTEQGTLMKVIGEDMKQLHEDVSRGIRGGSCLIKQKAAFDSAMEKAILEHADENEREQYEDIQLKMKHAAQCNTYELLKESGEELNIKKCDEEHCEEGTLTKIKNCILHATKTIVAFDFNNLYGQCLTEKMPLDNFDYLTDDELKNHQKQFNEISAGKNHDQYYETSAEEGYIFVSQLEFPPETQKKLLSYPQVPEHLIVEEHMLSENQKSLWGALFSEPYDNSIHKKMVNSFKTKENYTSHYRLLLFYAEIGVKITLSRGYKFRQQNFITPYVEHCANLRKNSTNDADKKMYKDMNNIIFGKFIGKFH
jgi:hypothetical protein